MKRNVFGQAAGVVLVMVAWPAAVAGDAVEVLPQPVSGKFSWVYRYDEGKELARQSGKPLFVVFRCER
jgi:hypothetical protein